MPCSLRTGEENVPAPDARVISSTIEMVDTNTPIEVAVIDEAQAIKNPAAQQTRAVKKLQAGTRIALTGTPVENRLSDLWSIFDFTHPGLLGSERVFAHFAKRLGETGQIVLMRLMAFILLCVGIQIVWEGVRVLLRSLTTGS